MQTGDLLLGRRKSGSPGSLEKAARLLRRSAERAEVGLISLAALQLEGEMVFHCVKRPVLETLQTIRGAVTRKEAPFYLPPRSASESEKKPGLDVE